MILPLPYPVVPMGCELPHLALWNKVRYMFAIGRTNLNNAVCRGISKRKFEQIRDHFLRLRYGKNQQGYRSATMQLNLIGTAILDELVRPPRWNEATNTTTSLCTLCICSSRHGTSIRKL
jgi:hypothetical protein